MAAIVNLYANMTQDHRMLLDCSVSVSGDMHIPLYIFQDCTRHLQTGDAEKDKLRASLGSAILAERPNVKVCSLIKLPMF